MMINKNPLGGKNWSAVMRLLVILENFPGDTWKEEMFAPYPHPKDPFFFINNSIDFIN